MYGRGGGTGAAPEIFRDHISVPTIPALARARRFLDQQGVSGEVTLLITGGLRTPVDFVKALALGAHAVMVGRPLLYALAVGGERAQERAAHEELLGEDVLRKAFAQHRHGRVSSLLELLDARPHRDPLTVDLDR